MLCFDQCVTGLEVPYGSHLVLESELIAFARELDPQPMHLDPASAQARAMGGLLGSGWQTAAINHAMMLSLFDPAEIISVPGVPRLRWAAPVRVGDVLNGVARVLRRRLSTSKPGEGLLDLGLTLSNQCGEVVLEVDQCLMLRSASLRLPDAEAALMPPLADTPPAFTGEAAFRPVQEMHPGQVLCAGTHVFDVNSTRTFASRYDPLPCLLAQRPRISGWQIGAQWLRLMVDQFHAREQAGEVLPKRGPGMGLADMVWRKPVHPGEELRYLSRVLAARPSASKPGWGILTLRNYALDAEGEAVMACTCHWLWEARKS